MTDNVMVFAPAPQLTVTIEQRDHGVEIHLHPGAQGVWQARMITCLGVPVVLCASLGGEIGDVLQALLIREGLQPRIVHRQSTSGGYVHDRPGGERNEIAEVVDLPLNRHELDELYNLTLAEGIRAAVSLLSGPAGGSVPADVYRRLAADLGSNDSRVVADLSGERLDAALDSGLCFLKVSHEELIRDGRASDESDAALVTAMQELHRGGAESVVVSRAERPALALLDGAVFEVETPRLQAVDPRGAGDTMTAGVAAVLARGGDVRTAVRTGAAAGALNVTRHGPGTGRADAIDALIDKVRLTPLRAGRQERMTPDELAKRTRS